MWHKLLLPSSAGTSLVATEHKLLLDLHFELPSGEALLHVTASGVCVLCVLYTCYTRYIEPKSILT